jgi:hypothetical protein
MTSGDRFPADLLAWQVRVRAHTMQARSGTPHPGVAPLVIVRRPESLAGMTAHSVICGLLPRAELIESRTKELRALYESAIPEGARVLYERGVAYLKGRYEDPRDFDPASLTTLLPRLSPLLTALRAEPRCALVFHVFDLLDRSEIGRLRCWQVDARAELVDAGPVYEHVWWHNALFHGAADDHAVVHFRCETLYDTCFGGLEPIARRP